MADYRDFTYGDVRFISGPVGWRDWFRPIPLIGKRLRRWPFFSGNKKAFYIKVRLAKGSGARKVSLRGELIGPDQRPMRGYLDGDYGPSYGGIPSNVDIPHTYRIHTPWLGGVGQHRFDASISIDEQGLGSETFVNFDLKSSDTLFLAILAIIVSVLIGILSPIFGAWLGKAAFTQNSPNPVVVIVATPTPTFVPTITPTPAATLPPTSHSETGSNAP